MEKSPWRLSGPLEWQRDTLKGSHHPVSLLVFPRHSGSEGSHLGAATWFLLCPFTQEEEVTEGRSQEQDRCHESWECPEWWLLADWWVVHIQMEDCEPSKVLPKESRLPVLRTALCLCVFGKIIMTLSRIRLFWEKNKRLLVIFEVKAHHYMIVIITSFQEIRTDSQHTYLSKKNNRSLIQQNSLVITVHRDSCCVHSWVMNGFSFKEMEKNFLKGRQEKTRL